ncbi:tRNA pseudouridine synthase B [Hortaea werneckii]|nr:tRNA pseudouridine synthase B [Hortaea werneckii]
MPPDTNPADPVSFSSPAINKPRGKTSAQVIRDVQSHFNPSALFQPWLHAERARRDRESHNQKQKRRSWKQRQPIQVKIGHGGTLDPLASGVLILGIGAGTKRLNEFLECTKSYETVLLFGAATDSYDTEGKIVARKPYGHVTREVMEEKVKAFRGKIMQKPPIFSAKRIQGKRLYEYAREGKSLPEGYQIEECSVDVKELEVLEWLEGGKHGFAWPGTEAEGEEKRLVDEVLGLEDQGNEATKQAGAVGKRKRDGEDEKHEAREEETVGGAVTADDGSLPAPPSPKRAKAAPQPSEETPVVSGALPKEPSIPEPQVAPVDATPTTENPVNAATTSPDQPLPTTEVSPASSTSPPCPAPAIRLRMTVTSGFYVRSLCHDLGAAVDSLGCMAELARTRQGGFELGVNALPYEDLAKGEEVWGPQVRSMLEKWNGKEEDGGKGPEEKTDGEDRGRRNTSSDGE